MPTFRILDQAPQYLLPSGAVNDGGSLTFYETDLTTEKTTWADPDKSTPNANPVVLDAAGRAGTDIWGDGEYGVVMKDAAGVTIWTRNNVEIPGGTWSALPTPVAGQFIYSVDGVTFSMKAVLEVPDPTGLANYYLVSDGTGVPLWQQIPDPPEPPTPDFENGTDFVRIGTYLRQWGTGTAPAAPTAKSSSVNITFPQAFSATPKHPSVTINNAGGSTPSGAICTVAVTNLTTTGMTVTVNMPDDDSNSSWKLANSTPFSYAVEGPTLAD